jgi:selenide,water dikinase
VAIGIVLPEKVIKNTGAQPGDALILTKPIGVGILSTALKRGLLDETTKNLIVASMSELNANAATVMNDFRSTPAPILPALDCSVICMK